MAEKYLRTMLGLLTLALALPSWASGAAGRALPELLAAQNLAQGCYHGSNSLSLANPGGNNTLLLLRIESGTVAVPSFITYAGVNLKLLRKDPGYKGLLLTYFLVNPAKGQNKLDINYAKDGCSWNVDAELYQGVDQALPIGNSSFAKGKAKEFSTTLKAKGQASLLSDFLAIANVSSIQGLKLGEGQENFNFDTGCCEEVMGDSKAAGPAAEQALSYALDQEKPFASQLVEIMAAASSASAAPDAPKQEGCAKAPSLLLARTVAKGCIKDKVTRIKLRLPEARQGLLLLRIEAGGGAAGLMEDASLSFAGKALKLFASDPGYDDLRLLTYYLAQPAAGEGELEIALKESSCNWNVVAELYEGVDPNHPLGAHSAQTGENAPNFITRIKAQGSASALDDFLAVSNVVSGGVQVELGLKQESHGFASGCCEEIYGDWKPLSGNAGPQEMTYALSQNKSYASQLIEVRSGSCAQKP